MRGVFRVLVCVSLCAALLVCPVFGADVSNVPDSGVVDYTIRLDVSPSAAPQLVSSTYSQLGPITSDNTTGLVSLVLGVIGPYDPIVAEYQYQGNNGYTQYVREIQPDYVWLVSAGIFALILFCVFRLWGLWLCSL